MNQKNKKVMMIVGTVIAVFVVFYAGMRYGQTSSAQLSAGQRVGGNGQFIQNMNGQRTARNFGGVIAGEIINMDNQSLTVKTRDGSSRLVFYNASTTVAKETKGTVADLTKGNQVSVNGNANTDGSVNAQMIQLRPIDL